MTDSLLVATVAFILAGGTRFMAFSGLALLLFFLLSSWMIVYFRLHFHYLMTMAFLLPFSVEIQLSDTIRLFVPGEPMIMIALFTIAWEIIRRPRLIHTLFSGESRWAIPLILSFIISLIFSTMKIVSIKFSLINLSYLLVFYLWQKLLFKERPDLFPRLLLLFSLSQILVLFYSIYQFAGYEFNTVTIKGIFRPFYKDHTILGATGALLSIYWLFGLEKAQKAMGKLLSVFLGLLFLGSVLLSFSRAAFLSMVFAAILWIGIQFHIRIKHLVIMALAGLLLLAIYRQPVMETLSSNKNLSHDASASYLERLESSSNISTDISNLERLNRWHAGLKMALQKPITGYGPGTYQFQYIPFQSPQLMNRLTVKNYWHIPENSGGTAHSEYVLAISEMGIIGLLALLVFFGRWMWICLEKTHAEVRRRDIVIAFTVLSTYLFHGAFNNFLNTDKFAFLFWGFAAWLTANYELIKKTNTENAHHEAVAIHPGAR